MQPERGRHKDDANLDEVIPPTLRTGQPPERSLPGPEVASYAVLVFYGDELPFVRLGSRSGRRSLVESDIALKLGSGGPSSLRYWLIRHRAAQPGLLPGTGHSLHRPPPTCGRVLRFCRAGDAQRPASASWTAFGAISKIELGLVRLANTRSEIAHRVSVVGFNRQHLLPFFDAFLDTDLAGSRTVPTIL